jgi:hypothetical protein
MKAESRNFRFHPSAFIISFSRALHLDGFEQPGSKSFSTLWQALI